MRNYFLVMLPYNVCRSTGIQYFRDHISTTFHLSSGTVYVFFSAERTSWQARDTSLVKKASIMQILSGGPACLWAHSARSIINNQPMSSTASNLTAFFIRVCYGSIMLTFSLASASIFNHGIWPRCCSSSASASCQSLGLQRRIRALTAAMWK